jgi:hypothetical protein
MCVLGPKKGGCCWAGLHMASGGGAGSGWALLSAPW